MILKAKVESCLDGRISKGDDGFPELQRGMVQFIKQATVHITRNQILPCGAQESQPGMIE